MFARATLTVYRGGRTFMKTVIAQQENTKLRAANKVAKRRKPHKRKQAKAEGTREAR